MVFSNMKKILDNNRLILMEGAVVEQLRRSEKVKLHPTLINAPLIYNEGERAELAKIYQNYINVAVEAETPLLICTPTWRANPERLKNSGVKLTINSDAVEFLKELRREQPSGKELIFIGGMIGCKNDCYLPEEGLSTKDSERFHSWQIEELANAGVDFLIAETLPNTEEAIGIAKSMEKSGIPYIISFVISREGKVLDGIGLAEAAERVDMATKDKPLGFMVNCAYPTFLCAENQPATLFERLIGYQANASSLDHCDLEGAEELKAESVSDWGAEMLKLNRSFGVKILGGCCGTGVDHLHYLVTEK